MEVFSIQDISKLAYPQYCNEEHFPSWQQLIEKNKKFLKKLVAKNLKERNLAHPDVIAHWKMIQSLC